MSVREFDGTDDIIVLSPGSVAISNFAQGNYSIVGVVKPTSMSGTEAIIGIQVTTSSLKTSMVCDSSANLGIADDVDLYVATVSVGTTWQILAITKATGTSAIRCHRKEMGAGSWTHSNTATTTAGTSGTPGRIDVGAYLGGGFSSFKDMRLASLAVYSTTLSDGNVESVQTTPSTQQLSDLGAIALWDFNQASTGTAVVDLVGDADQSSITGTSVVGGDDPPSWTFGVGSVAPTLNTVVRK